MSSLFRKQALDAQQHRLLGTISLAQPLSMSVVTLILLGLLTGIVTFLCFSEYARKETVKGYLKPEKGLIKAYTNRNGVIERLFVQEGTLVQAGQPLVSIISSQTLTSGEELSDKLSAELNKQLVWLQFEHQQISRMQLAEQTRLEQRKLSLINSMQVVANQQKLQAKKISLLDQQQVQYQKLKIEGYIAELEFQQQQEKQLNARQELENLKRVKLDKLNDIKQIEHELKVLPDQFTVNAVEISRKQSDIQSQLSQIDNNHRIVINATYDGYVTAIQIEEGQNVTASTPMLSLLPTGTVLVAELMLPTRSAGFVKKGDIARLRFDAFPHQRFGLMLSHIDQIDLALITSNSPNIPIQLNEPMYRVRSRLSEQLIEGYGQSFALKSGMLFEADIILDKRSLLDWLLDPIYSLNGRVN